MSWETGAPARCAAAPGLLSPGEPLPSVLSVSLHSDDKIMPSLSQPPKSNEIGMILSEITTRSVSLENLLLDLYSHKSSCDISVVGKLLLRLCS